MREKGGNYENICNILQSKSAKRWETTKNKVATGFKGYRTGLSTTFQVAGKSVQVAG